ncbi:MAG: hypothetical protein ABI569_14285 [Casimicrobiaceae bacterium]
MKTRLASRALAALLLALSGVPIAVLAQGFAAMVSPPRFELPVKPGETTRQIVEITNADARPAIYRLHTADWTFDANATVTLTDALTPGSCRPWVAIERREIIVPAGGRYRYRFEVTPPADATGECRFALVLEGGGEAVDAGLNIKVPISGQIGVIVYATIAGAEPELEIVSTGVGLQDGRKLPMLRVKNSGRAHGRLAGFLSGTDASGKSLEFMPAGLPILPGETRAIALGVAGDDANAVAIAYPITIRGTLEWGGRSTPLDVRFAP